jgi:hypothetical protein
VGVGEEGLLRAEMGLVRRAGGRRYRLGAWRRRRGLVVELEELVKRLWSAGRRAGRNAGLELLSEGGWSGCMVLERGGKGRQCGLVIWRP